VIFSSKKLRDLKSGEERVLITKALNSTRRFCVKSQNVIPCSTVETREQR
jgi:hypothetical protein